jgi:hypothetical protein
MHEVPGKESPIFPVLDGVTLVSSELAPLLAAGRQDDARNEDGEDRSPLAQSPNCDV